MDKVVGRLKAMLGNRVLHAQVGVESVWGGEEVRFTVRFIEIPGLVLEVDVDAEKVLIDIGESRNG